MANIAELVGSVARALEPYLREPYALFGYSMGALLAFELARALRRSRLPAPAGLFVASMWAPQITPVIPPLSKLPRTQLLDGIERYFQPEDAAWKMPDLVDVLLPILRDDLALIDNYRYAAAPPLQSPLHVYAGADDRAAPLSTVEAWRDQAANEFNLTVFPDRHFFRDSAERAMQLDIQRSLAGWRNSACRSE